LEIFAIVNPIVNFKALALDQIKSYKLNFFSQCLFHIDTTQNKWSKLQAQIWYKMEHPTVHHKCLQVVQSRVIFLGPHDGNFIQAIHFNPPCPKSSFNQSKSKKKHLPLPLVYLQGQGNLAIKGASKFSFRE
jgi:hypothetical protein